MEGPLSQIRDNFYAGYYSRCLSIAARTPPPVDDFARNELYSITLRASAAISRENGATPGPTHTNSIVLSTINYIDFWQADTEAQKRIALFALKDRAQLVAESITHFLTSAALISEGPDYDPLEALRLSQQGPSELKLLRLVELVLIDRSDLAQDVAKNLISLNDDAVMSKLASAIISVVSGSYQEAYLTYNDVTVQCCEGEEEEGSSSVYLFNGKAVALMHGHHWDQALEDLQKAHTQDPRDVDTIANLITCYQWTNNEAEKNKMIRILADLDPEHRLMKELTSITESFAKFLVLHPLSCAFSSQ